MKRLLSILLFALSLCLTLNAAPQYTKREAMVPMRDGVSLYTTVYEPQGLAETRPIIIRRSPYGTGAKGDPEFSKHITRVLRQFYEQGYIIVQQDVRGKCESEGDFVEVRPIDPEAAHGPANGNLRTDEATDTYDTIEWLVANTDNNGCVGVTGVSYPGFYATAAAVCGHPALKAVAPQAPVTDWYIGDDMHSGGVFIYQKPFRGLESQFLDRKACSAHPDYDSFWQAMDPTRHLKDVAPAVLVVGGTYDDEDWYGALKTYRSLLEQSPQTETYFVVGPWTHMEWHGDGWEGIENFKFGPGTDTWFEALELQFFAYYLEGKGSAPSPVSIIPSFFNNTRNWSVETLDALPEYKAKPLYLKASKKASFRKPLRFFSKEKYIADPADPVPHALKECYYQILDQRFLGDREDVRSFSSEAIKDTMALCGPIFADLWFSTDAADLDFVVKLLDVAPDGSQMMVRAQIFRARYRNGFHDGHDFLIPGKKYRMKMEMWDVFHEVLPGHSLMVQIQNSWFPLAELNPQTAVDNIYFAEPEDFKAAEVTIYHNFIHPSRLELPLRKK